MHPDRFADLPEDRVAALRSLESSFSELFAQTRRLFAEFAERISPGMLPGSYRLFSTVARRGPVTASELADELLLDKGHVSRMLKELVALGLIQSTPDEADRRSRLLSVTPLGLERLDAAREPMHDQLSTGLTAWSTEEINSLTDLLHAFATGVQPPRRD